MTRMMSISWRTKRGPATCRKIASCHQHLNKGMMGKTAVDKSLSISQVVICNQWKSVKERACEAPVRYWMTSYSVGTATPKTQFSIGLHETSCQLLLAASTSGKRHSFAESSCKVGLSLSPGRFRAWGTLCLSSSC